MAISKEELIKIDKYYRALNYVAAAQLYLLDNPLLKRKLELSDVKSKIIGHWGTVPAQTLIYTHLNRIIKNNDTDMIYISGPGHGGNSVVAATYLEGSYTKVYPDITKDEEGLKKLFKQFSFPGGVSSHAAPETPGSIHEGGELGYSLAHAYGAVLDNPNLIAACVIGDGEAETGPLATSWNVNRFLDVKNDGVVLPILNLNGFKINNPTLLARISKDELVSYFKGLGYKPYIVSMDYSMNLHKKLANTLDKVMLDIKKIKEGNSKNVVWPMVILQTPKGMTGPKEIVGTYKAHQVPFQVENSADVQRLEDWLKSYKPDELFDEKGSLIEELEALNPKESKLMGLSKYTNGGLLLKDLKLPNITKYQVKVTTPGSVKTSDMMELGKYLKDVFVLNKKNKNFRIFGPDEAISNRLNHVFEVENKGWNLKLNSDEQMLAKDGRVFDSYLSEHVCQGALEAYLLTGRHGFIHSYESFVRVIDSMTSQHAKWLKVTKELDWRRDIASLNYILSSHVWQQDHNGYTHQDPGFLNHLATKKTDIARIYLPYDANSLISCTNHILGTKNHINVIVASKHPSYQWLDMNKTIEHCTKGISRWDFCSNDTKKEIDVVLACAGDTPTLEVIAATTILKEYLPTLKVRVVNVVDLFKLVSNKRHPHGLTTREYNDLFTKDKPIVFNFHGYPNLIHELTYDRDNDNMHVRGYNEEGTITTSFDMRVQNKIDRYNLVLDVLKYTNAKNKKLESYCNSMLKKHNSYIKEYGKDIEEVANWEFK